MTATNSRFEFAERLCLGICGATLVLLPAYFNWLRATSALPEAVRYYEYGGLIALIIAWLITVWATARQLDPSWWRCFFQAVGIPGTVLSLGKLYAVSGLGQ